MTEGQLTKFQFFPPNSIYYHPPQIVKILKNSNPLIIATPPLPNNLTESRWKKKYFVLVEGF